MDKVNVRPLAKRKLRYRSRSSQVPIYLGKLMRSFIYQNDWKLLPMSAIVAALVSIVVRKDFFLTMEGTLKGAFALTCVSIWNGCFNSIQSVCRERGIIKREHRSGMHISSYVFSHMVYQALLCLVQTGVTMYVALLMGIHFPKEGFLTPYMIVDIGITVFLISYSADMLSLLVSCLSHTTTAAMTVMPFLLIFQLIFSGGIFSLPEWTQGFSNFTISNYGLKCIAAQADYNSLPMVTAWNTLVKIKDEEITCTVTAGQLLDAAQSGDSPLLQSGEEQELIAGLTAGEALDLLTNDPALEEYREAPINLTFTAGQLIDFFGEDAVRSALQGKTAQASQMAAYERTQGNIWFCWRRIILFGLACVFLSVIVLEFIDKDKR